MAISKKPHTKKRLFIKHLFGVLLIFLGMGLDYGNIGTHTFFSYSSVGTYLFYVGLLVIIFSTYAYWRNKDSIIDERAERIAYHAMRSTLLFLFLGSFIMIIVDGIFAFPISISQFLSWLICSILIFYILAYKITERYFL